MSRKTDAIDIAIECVRSIKLHNWQEEKANRDIQSVLEEAKLYFKEQEKPKENTLKDHYPAGYREPICPECCLYDEIKEEICGELIKAGEKACIVLETVPRFRLPAFEKINSRDVAKELADAIAKAKEKK